MDFAAAVLAAIAAIALILSLARRSERRVSVLAAAGLSEMGIPPARPRIRPISSLKAGLSWMGRKISPRSGDEAARLLAESGTAWTTEYLQGLRLGAGLTLASLLLPLGLAGFPLTPLLFAAGYHAPVLVLKRKLRRRWEQVASDLPEVVDLMAVLCFSGESLSRALNHSVTACSHPSSRAEIGSVLEHMRLGESTAEALSRAAGHPCREMRRFARTLLRAEELGAPIADTLEELAVELRNGRREKDRVRASRVSVLILFPLVFLILPSFLLLTVGGMILGYTL
jgi:tight adherence protein C